MENYFYGLSKVDSTDISMVAIKSKIKNCFAKNGWFLNISICFSISGLFGLVFGLLCVLITGMKLVEWL